jgi:O-antigen/teichoic acid export membrane protein
MLRQILAFAPASVAPALLSFGFVYVFTRTLTPSEYGTYTLVSNVVMFIQAVLFWSLSSAMVRFYPEAEKTSRIDTLLKTGYSMFAVGLALLFVVSPLVALLPVDPVMWFVVPLLAVRSGANLSLALYRITGESGRYNVVVLIENIVGFFAAIALVRVAPSASSLLLGLCVGSLCCVVVYGPWVISAFRNGRIESSLVERFWTYGVPIGLAFILSQSSAYTDRFVITWFAGSHQLAIYAVASSLVIQPISLIGAAISAATLPLSIQELERHGVEAGRRQAGRNGVMIMALTAPGCAGLAVCHHQIADLLTGEQFRIVVAQLIPWIAGIAFLYGVSNFYLGQAFYMAVRPNQLLWALGPASLATLVLNVALVPFFGLWGAVVSAGISQIVLMASLLVVGRRVFSLPVPREAGRIAVATACMSALVYWIDAPDTWSGLLLQIIAGGIAYGLLTLGLFQAEIRSWISSRG